MVGLRTTHIEGFSSCFVHLDISKAGTVTEKVGKRFIPFNLPVAIMKIKQLLNSDYKVDLGGRLLGPELESTVEAARLGQIDLEHDAVYFGGDSSPESFSGHLSCGLDDDEVIEFIRRTNPALHDRLWGTPPPQIVTPVALAITGQLELSDEAANDSTAIGATNGQHCDNTTTSSKTNGLSTRRSTLTAPPNFPAFITSFESCGGDVLGQSSRNEAAQRQVASVSRSQNELQQDLYLLQLRRYVQSLLLSQSDDPLQSFLR
jgi:hypothetical protein